MRVSWWFTWVLVEFIVKTNGGHKVFLMYCFKLYSLSFDRFCLRDQHTGDTHLIKVNLTQNHRIIGIGRNLWRTSSPIPSLKQVPPYNRLQKKVSRWVLNISREKDSKISLGSFFQFSVASKVKRFIWTSSVAVCTHCSLFCLWEPPKSSWPHCSDTRPLDIYKHW